MKKQLLVLSLVSLLGLTTGCTSNFKSKEWTYSKVSSVEFNEVLFNDEYYSEVIEDLYTENNVDNLSDLNAKLLEKYNTENTFASSYVKFSGDKVYLYDTLMEREATYFLREGTETSGHFVLSDYLLTCPVEELSLEISPHYNVSSDGNTLSVTSYYINQFITIEYIEK